jgi:diaminohydroxyphosphoribosylaminopyrimidine deaminase/5-amino-6-(5-phosphoribosylamino)uracil reductase
VLVEGGSRLLSSFIDRKSADKLFLTVSPKLIGGEESPSFYGGLGAGLIKDAIPVKSLSLLRIGEDSVLEGYF